MKISNGTIWKDTDGNVLETRERLVNDLWMSPQTWYFTDALSSTITVREDGKITIEGMDTGWFENIIPPNDCGFTNDPIISSGDYLPLEERE